MILDKLVISLILSFSICEMGILVVFAVVRTKCVERTDSGIEPWLFLFYFFRAFLLLLPGL